MSDQKLKIAVFIDFDNVEIGVKTTLGLQFDIGAVLEAIKERGSMIFVPSSAVETMGLGSMMGAA